MRRLKLRWRFFWARRSPKRIIASLALGFVALLASTYLALPLATQDQIVQVLQGGVAGIKSLSLDSLVAVAAGLCMFLSLLIVFARPYRRHAYLATTPSIIPPVSVYVDAENQLPEAAIRPFTTFLLKHLDGRRADLLYFLDASRVSTGPKYKTLYRFGFRPVDVPHDPTGRAEVKEAVDKELAMHAYERALLGPPGQEFIIVTGDQDFVALVYRLTALGHHVQIWASPIRPAYRVLATYLDVELIDLAHVISELEPPSNGAGLSSSIKTDLKGSGVAANQVVSTRTTAAAAAVVAADDVPPSILSQAGEQQIYWAIVRTLEAHAKCEEKPGKAKARDNWFRGRLGGELAPRLASVGYTAASKIDYWIEHLLALRVLREGSGSFPSLGAAPAEDAARTLFSVAKAAAIATVGAAHDHPDGRVTTTDVANALASGQLKAGAAEQSLLRLVAPGNAKRSTHARYFVRSARALGLLEFDDVPNQLDSIQSPRLVDAEHEAVEDQIADRGGAAPESESPPTGGGSGEHAAATFQTAQRSELDDTTIGRNAESDSALGAVRPNDEATGSPELNNDTFS